MAGKKETLVKNALIIAFGNAFVQGISFFLLPFYTAHLSVKDFGVVDVISTYSLLLVPLLTLEIGIAAFRYLIDARADEKQKTKIITNSLRMVGILLVFVIAILVLVLRFVHILYGALAIAGVASAILPALLGQYARGLDKIKVFTLSSVIAGIITITLNIVLIGPLHMGAKGMLIAGIVGNLVSTVYLCIALRLHRYINFKVNDKALQKELLSYSMPLIPNAVSWWVINAADRTIIAIFLGLSSNGIYAVAYKFPTVYATVFSYFGLSWAESASVHINGEDRDKFFSDILTESVKFFGCLAALMVAAMPFVFQVFVDKAYHAAYSYTLILIGASFFSALAAMYGAIYIAKKMTKQIATTTVVAGIVNIVFSVAFIKVLGLYATAIATVISYFGLAVYRHYDSKKYVTIRYGEQVLLKVGLLFALAAALYYYNSLLSNIVNLVICLVASVVLNKSIVATVRNKVYGTLKKLSPRQAVAEQETYRNDIM